MIARMLGELAFGARMLGWIFGVYVALTAVPFIGDSPVLATLVLAAAFAGAGEGVRWVLHKMCARFFGVKL